MTDSTSQTTEQPMPADVETDARNESDAPGQPIGVHPAAFAEMTSSKATTSELPLSRFLDVTLNASVELGHALIPIGELLKLGEGAVLELDREVTEPVDIMVQGVRLARGEVVIVEGQYAVRITEVESGQMNRMGPPNGTTKQSPTATN